MRHFLLVLLTCTISNALNLDFLDPTKLQTKTPASVQQQAAIDIIAKYSNQVIVEVNPILFQNNKDVFSLRTSQGQLRIRASTGVAAVWGFNYYLKKYCKSQIAWQNQRLAIPDPLPEVDEFVVASDRFRYYQNVCTASYSFVWWNSDDWKNHVEWMALNGINLALAPVAQEAAWARVYQKLGMKKDEIDQHFTGPAFLAWLRMGNLRGWGGPLLKSWHDRQKDIQDTIVDYMFRLGIVPVFPAFNGHVPRAISRIYPNTTLHTVETWNKFGDSYCCDYFIDPNDPLFKTIGMLFLREVTAGTASDHIYAADPFNEIKVAGWSTSLVRDTAKAIFSTIYESDDNAVWLVQNWMFAHDPVLWPKSRVEAFLTAVPRGRMLVLDLQSEQWPQYNLYEMYFGQPFIWCMLHNFGGTLGMFGSVQTINNDIYEVRNRVNSTMIGIGLTPEGINQNYVIYDLMLETGWRKEPIQDLDKWVADYAERRYGCNNTTDAWKLLLHSVYNFEGLNKIRGKYVVTRRPSLRIKPWAWYKSKDLFDAFKTFVFVMNSDCFSSGFNHDLVDITRQALQYRAEQLYINILDNRYSSTWVYNATINQFLDIMQDIESILTTNQDFSISNWLSKARSFGSSEETFFYEMNARNQITLWGPNGEITDYACKQWAEVFHYYYIPRWTLFLSAAFDAKARNEIFDERATQKLVRATVEKQFLYVDISTSSFGDPHEIARKLFEKWAYAPDLDDLPLNVIPREPNQKTTLADVDEDDNVASEHPTVMLLHSTTPNV
ncbi:unnamed protein product [Diatraea saccharalis]|uniref:Alpha-N-acetylglucosaminidase n=1 Tax=Diatraea saccharalis TaxID=40085 RepID=A0A9N9WC01_9NEOP|nr:unnamed protein product [Diatraea saccharalis]